MELSSSLLVLDRRAQNKPTAATTMQNANGTLIFQADSGRDSVVGEDDGGVAGGMIAAEFTCNRAESSAWDQVNAVVIAADDFVVDCW